MKEKKEGEEKEKKKEILFECIPIVLGVKATILSDTGEQLTSRVRGALKRHREYLDRPTDLIHLRRHSRG